LLAKIIFMNFSASGVSWQTDNAFLRSYTCPCAVPAMQPDARYFPADPHPYMTAFQFPMPFFIVLNAASGRQQPDDTRAVLSEVIRNAGREHHLHLAETPADLASAARLAVEKATRVGGAVVVAIGTLGDAKQVRTFPLRELHVTRSGRPARRIKVALDGEILRLDEPLHFQVSPRPLCLPKPASAAGGAA